MCSGTLIRANRSCPSLVSDQHRKVEAAIGDVRKRPAGIEGQRRQHRKNRFSEIGIRVRCCLSFNSA